MTPDDFAIKTHTLSVIVVFDKTKQANEHKTMPIISLLLARTGNEGSSVVNLLHY